MACGKRCLADYTGSMIYHMLIRLRRKSTLSKAQLGVYREISMIANHRSYEEYIRFSENEMKVRSSEFLSHMQTRRSIRHFSNESVERTLVDQCLQVAALAPNGANRQPWTFVVVENVAVRKQIRDAAEEEERAFYSNRAPDEWLNALAPLGTDASKPFLETAPVLICIFAENWRLANDGTRQKNYYVAESVGIATGFLIAALHHAGLATLTHTPSPMKFLNRILDRPKSEKAFLLLVAGFPEPNCQVPVLTKRAFDEVVIRR